MKKFRPFLALLLACWLLAAPALADDEISSTSDSAPSVSDETPPEPPADPDQPADPDPPVDFNPPVDPDFPVDPAPPVDPPPELPPEELPPEELPPEVSPTDVPVIPPDLPGELPPSYVIPNTPLVPGTITNAGIEETPDVENHQIFTITTIPEFARAALEFDFGNMMAQVVRDLFGTYTPKVQTVTTHMDGEPIAVEE